MAILVTISLMCIMLSAVFLLSSDEINLYYILLSILVLLVVHVTLFTNISLRLYYVISGKDSKYLDSTREEIEKLVKILHENHSQKNSDEPSIEVVVASVCVFRYFCIF